MMKLLMALFSTLATAVLAASGNQNIHAFPGLEWMGLTHAGIGLGTIVVMGFACSDLMGVWKKTEQVPKGQGPRMHPEKPHPHMALSGRM